MMDLILFFTMTFEMYGNNNFWLHFITQYSNFLYTLLFFEYKCLNCIYEDMIQIFTKENPPKISNSYRN